MSSNLKAQLKALLAAKEYRAALVLLETSSLPDKQTYIERIQKRMAEEAPAAPMPQKPKTAPKSGHSMLYYGSMAALLSVLAILVVGIAGYLGSDRSSAGSSSGSSASGKWVVDEDTNAFDDSTSVFLLLRADNSVRTWLNTETPVLVLRCKERKLEAYIDAKTQFEVELDENYDNSPTVRLRFDSDQAYTMRMSESTDGEAVFFGDAEGLITRMETASTLVMGFTPFNASPVQATFDVRGLSNISPMLWSRC